MLSPLPFNEASPTWRPKTHCSNTFKTIMQNTAPPLGMCAEPPPFYLADPRLHTYIQLHMNLYLPPWVRRWHEVRSYNSFIITLILLWLRGPTHSFKCIFAPKKAVLLLLMFMYFNLYYFKMIRLSLLFETKIYIQQHLNAPFCMSNRQ